MTIREVIERRLRRQAKADSGAKTMQAEEPWTETEPAADQDPTDEDSVPEPMTPPIDEDVAGSVNAAVPDPDE